MAKGGNIRGITIEIGGDTTKLGNAIKDSEQKSKSLQTELKDINKLLKFDPTNVNLLTQKQSILTQTIEETRKKLDTLKEAEAQVVAQFERGEIGEDQLRAFQREIVSTQSWLGKLEGDLQNTNNSFSNLSNGAEETATSLASLKNTISEQEKQLMELKNAYTNVVLEQGAESSEAQELSARIVSLNHELNENKSTLSDAEKQTHQLTDAISENADETEESVNALEQLTSMIEEQEKELENLNKQYTNVILEQGKNSSEAQELRSRMTELNDELKDNRQKLHEAQGEADQLTDALDDVGDSTDNASKGFTVMKGAIADLISNGIQKAIGALKDIVNETINVGKEFDSSMSEVAAISGATGDELQTLRDTAKEFGENTVFSASESAQALKYMALAGWDTQKSVDALGGILDLASASGMELAHASDMVTDYLTAFGMEAKQSAYFADLLAYAQSNSNTTAEQLGEAYKNVAANMHGAGQDVETTTSLLAQMANQGLKGSEAGTALNAIMRDMTAKMKKGAIQIGKTKVEVMDANGNYRDMTNILADVEKATKGMGDAQKATALSSTFTSDSIKGLNLILNAGTDEARKFEEQLRNSEGTAKKMSETMNDNLDGDFKALSSKIEAVQIAMYEKFEPSLRTAVDALQKLTDGAGWLVEHSQDVIAGLTAMATAVGTYVAYTTAIKVMKEGWLALSVVQKIVTAGQMALNAVMAMNPIGIVVALIAGLVVAFMHLWNTSEDFRKFWINLWEKIKSFVSDAIKVVSEKFKELKQYITDFATATKEKVLSWANSIVKFFTVTIPAGFNDFIKNCKATLKKIEEWAKDLYEKMTTSVKNTIDAVVNFFKELPTNIWNFLKDCLIKVTNWGKTLIEKGKTTASDFLTNVINTIKQLPSKIWNAIKGAIDNVVKWESSMVSKATSAVKNVSKSIVDGLKSVPTKILSIGGDIVTGLWNGINNKVGWVLDKIKGFGSSIINGIKGVFDIHSPSRVMRDEVGKNIALGVGEGIRQFVNKVVEEAEHLGKKTTAAVEKSTKTISKKSTKTISKKSTKTISKKSTKTRTKKSTSKKSTVDQKRAKQYKKDTSNLALQIEKENASISKQINLWDNLRKKYKEGTTERRNADTKYYGLLNKQEDESYKKIVSNIVAKIKKNDLSYAKQADLWLKARNEYKKGTDEYKALDLKYTIAKNKVAEEQYKADVERIKLKVEQQELGANKELKLYKDLQAKYKKGTNERKKLDIEIAKLRKKARKERFEEDKDAINLKVEQEQLGANKQLKLWKALRKEYKAGTDERKEIDKEVAKLENNARKEKYDNLKATLQKEKDYDRLSLAQEVEYWNKIRKQFKKGTEEREQAELEYYNVKKELTQKIIDLEADYAEKVKTANESLIKSIQDTNKAYEDAVQTRADAIVNSMGLFDKFKHGDKVNGSDLLDNLQSQVDGLDDWKKELASLEGRGIDKALLEQLQKMGISAIGEIKALNSLTDEELDKYVELWQQKNALAKEQATHELEALKAETAQKIQELTQETASKLAEYQVTYMTSLQALGVSLNTQVSQTVQTLSDTTDKTQSDLLLCMADSGEKAVKNFSDKFTETAQSKKVKSQLETLNTTVINTIKPLVGKMVTIGNQIALGVAQGIQEKISIVRSAIEELMRLTVQQAKLSAGIHSPSRVMRDQVGKFLSEGIAVGIKDNTKSVTAVMDNMIGNLTNGLGDLNPLTFSRQLDHTFRMDANSNTLTDLVNIISYYMPRLIDASKHSIVLDSGALVGETIEDIDNRLAQLYTLRARGV